MTSNPPCVWRTGCTSPLLCGQAGHCMTKASTPQAREQVYHAALERIANPGEGTYPVAWQLSEIAQEALNAPTVEAAPPSSKTDLALLDSIANWFDNHPNVDLECGGIELLRQYRDGLRAIVSRGQFETTDGMCGEPLLTCTLPKGHNSAHFANLPAEKAAAPLEEIPARDEGETPDDYRRRLGLFGVHVPVEKADCTCGELWRQTHKAAHLLGCPALKTTERRDAPLWAGDGPGKPT
jgi:hypothetical protein